MAVAEDGADHLTLKAMENEKQFLRKYSPTIQQQQQQHGKEQEELHHFQPQKILPLDPISSSTTTTPPPNHNHHHHHHHHPLCGEVQVISAAGSHIIAVTNPALIMSPTLNDAISLKRETNIDSPDL